LAHSVAGIDGQSGLRRIMQVKWRAHHRSLRILSAACAAILWLITTRALLTFAGLASPCTPRWQQRSSKQPSRALSAETVQELAHNWRAFRAHLVQKEREAAGSAATDAPRATDEWLHGSPILEQGSILIAKPNATRFQFGRQYMHKSVILITAVTEFVIQGIIVNRPSAITGMEMFPRLGLDPRIDETIGPWSVWFGGDYCSLTCNFRGDSNFAHSLHLDPHLDFVSTEVFPGLYLMNAANADQVVIHEDANEEAFLTVSGFCMWFPEQLQQELEDGDTWTMVSASGKALLGNISETNAKLRAFLARRGEELTPSDLIDYSTESWVALQRAVAENEGTVLENEALETNQHLDRLLHLWVARNLMSKSSTALFADVHDLPQDQIKLSEFNTGGDELLLRASPTEWVLGTPAGLSHQARDELDKFASNHNGCIFMHKALVSVYTRSLPGKTDLVLVVLNGPRIRETGSDDTFFGGPQVAKLPGEDQPMKHLKRFGGRTKVFLGHFVLSRATIKELMLLGLFSEIESDTVDKIFESEAQGEEAWQLAGGELNSIGDAETALLGDVIRRRWFEERSDIDVHSI